jgi:hypothetical protein
MRLTTDALLDERVLDHMPVGERGVRPQATLERVSDVFHGYFTGSSRGSSNAEKHRAGARRRISELLCCYSNRSFRSSR